MNIIEALKSGRKFRRTSAVKDKWSCGWNNAHKENDKADLSNLMRVEDILADDWEVEEERVTLTKKEFLDAYLSSYLPFSGHPWTAVMTAHAFALWEKLSKFSK